MGLFGGKKNEKHAGGDSPVESVADTPSGALKDTAAPTPPAAPRYGIEDAIQLMRSLPVDQNADLVVHVIKTTLESLKVRVPDIIEDAAQKERNIEKRVSELRIEIGQFEGEIRTRKEDIARLEADHAETTKVKARLELAERLASGAKNAIRDQEITPPSIEIVSAAPLPAPAPPHMPPPPGFKAR